MVHGLAHAVAALAAAAEAGVPVLLASPVAAASAVGPGWFRALLDAAAKAQPTAIFEGMLDCTEAPGLALAALRIGIGAVRYDGPAAQRIADIARLSGGRLCRDMPAGLNLLAVEARRQDMTAACRAWIAAGPLQSAPPSGIPSDRKPG